MQRGISPPEYYSPPRAREARVQVQGPTNDLGVKWILGDEELACLRSRTTMDECLLIF